MAENLVTEIEITKLIYFIREHPVILCRGSSTCLGPIETLSKGFSEL